MNPCGRITDLISCAFDSDCKFYRNDGRVQTVRFFEAADDAPVLGMWNVIDSGTNEPKRWPEWTLGGRPQPSVTFTGQKAPAGLLYDHICGTPDDFANGAVFDAARPPLQIGAQGLPLCCSVPPLMLGAGGAGGKGVYNVIPVSVPTAWNLFNYDNFVGSSGVTFGSIDGGVPIVVYLLGTSLPPTPAGFTLFKTAVIDGGSVVVGCYLGARSGPSVFWQTPTTGAQKFSALVFTWNGSSLFDSGVVVSGFGNSATPPPVNTQTTTTVVVTLFAWTTFSGSWSPPVPSGWTTTFLGVNFFFNPFWGQPTGVSTGLPFTLGTGSWSFFQHYAAWNDAYI